MIPSSNLNEQNNSLLQQKSLHHAPFVMSDGGSHPNYQAEAPTESRHHKGILGWFRKARSWRRHSREINFDPNSYDSGPPRQQFVDPSMYFPTEDPNYYAMNQYGQNALPIDFQKPYLPESAIPLIEQPVERHVTISAPESLSEQRATARPGRISELTSYSTVESMQDSARPPPLYLDVPGTEPISEGMRPMVGRRLSRRDSIAAANPDDLPRIQVPPVSRRAVDGMPTPSFYQQPVGGVDTPYQRAVEERPILRTPSPIGRRRHRQKGLLHLHQPVDVLYWAQNPEVGGLGASPGGGLSTPVSLVSAKAESATGGGGDIYSANTVSGAPAFLGGSTDLTRTALSEDPPPYSALTVSYPLGATASANAASPGVSHPVWLPGRVLDLQGDIVKVQVYVPPRGIRQGTKTVAGWLRRLACQDSRRGLDELRGGVTKPSEWRPQLKVLELHKSEVPLRISVPAGFRSNVSGEAIQFLWPGTGPGAGPAKELGGGGRLATASAPDRSSGYGGQTAGEGGQEVSPLQSTSARRPIPAEFLSEDQRAAGIVGSQVVGSQGVGEAKRNVSFLEQEQEGQRAGISSRPMFTPFRGTINDVIQADSEQMIYRTKSDFLSMIQVGQEVDVQISGLWGRGLIMRVLTDGDLDPLIVQGQSQSRARAPEDTIGRGGFPLMPTPMVVDVLMICGDYIERVPLISSCIAPARSRTSDVLHVYKIGDAVDVLQGRRSQIVLPEGIVQQAEEDPKSVVSNTVIAAKEDRSRIRYTQWRVGIVEKGVSGLLQIRYCELTDEPDPLPLLLSPSTPDASTFSPASPPPRVANPPQFYKLTKLPPAVIDMDREAFRLRPHEPGQIEVDRDQAERFRDQKEGTWFLLVMERDGWDYWEPELECAHSTALPPILSLFHAVCHQVYGEVTPFRVFEIASMVAEHMRKYRDFFEPIVEAYAGKGDRGDRSDKHHSPKHVSGKSEPALRIQTSGRATGIFRAAGDYTASRPVVTLEQYLHKVDFITGASMRYTVEGAKTSCPASSLSLHPYFSFSPPLLGYCYPTLLAIEEVFDRPILVWKGEEFFLRKGMAKRRGRMSIADDSAFLPPPRNIHALETSTPPALVSLVLVPHITPFRLAYLGGGRWASIFPSEEAAKARGMRQSDVRWRKELQETDISFHYVRSMGGPQDIPYLRPERPPLGLLHTKKICLERLRVLGQSTREKEIILSYDHIAELRNRAASTPKVIAQSFPSQAYSCTTPIANLPPRDASKVELGSCLSAAEASGKECAESEVRKHVRRIASTNYSE